MITIEKAHPGHAPLLSDIGSRSLLESHGRSAPPEIMQAYVEDKFNRAALEKELSVESNLFHLIYYNNQPAGYSKIICDVPIEPVQSTQVTKMERLYLLQDFYGARLGHRLMEFNIELSKQLGQEGMWLYVWKGNNRAIRFYERAGFVIVGDGLFRLTDTHANPNWQMYLSYEKKEEENTRHPSQQTV